VVLGDQVAEAGLAILRAQERCDELVEQLQLSRYTRAGLSHEEASDAVLQKAAEVARVVAAETQRQYLARVKRFEEVVGVRMLATVAARVDGDCGVSSEAATIDCRRLGVLGDETENSLRVVLRQELGAELVVGETGYSVMISSDDPFCREIALRVTRCAINKVDSDIDALTNFVANARDQCEAECRRGARRVLALLRAAEFPAALIEPFGRLRHRFSYSQNQLHHSTEVALIAGMLASELGLELVTSRQCVRAALLHDIGKADSHTYDGSHAEYGAGLCEEVGESPEVVNAVGAHHGDREPSGVVATLVIVADILSAARPGARRDDAAAFLRRLDDLQEIAMSHPAVSCVQVTASGHEVMVYVDGGERQATDEQWLQGVAKSVSEAIAEDVVVPGRVRVTAVFESTAIAIAS